jgi:hypothetical protein
VDAHLTSNGYALEPQGKEKILIGCLLISNRRPSPGQVAYLTSLGVALGMTPAAIAALLGTVGGAADEGGQTKRTTSYVALAAGVIVVSVGFDWIWSAIAHGTFDLATSAGGAAIVVCSILIASWLRGRMGMA